MKGGVNCGGDSRPSCSDGGRDGSSSSLRDVSSDDGEAGGGARWRWAGVTESPLDTYVSVPVMSSITLIDQVKTAES